MNAGTPISQTRMKMTNWRRLTMFQRYLRPIARKRFKTRLLTEKAASVVVRLSPKASSFSYSAMSKIGGTSTST